MKQQTNRDKCFKDTIRAVQPNKKITQNNTGSRIPIRIPPNAKIADPSALPKHSCIPTKKPLTSLPEKPYGRDRARLMSSYGKRFGKSALESQISLKCRKENWERSKLIRQQFSYGKECEEIRVLLEKMQINASGDSTTDQNGCQFSTDDRTHDRRIDDLSSVYLHILLPRIMTIFLASLKVRVKMLFNCTTMKP